MATRLYWRASISRVDGGSIITLARLRLHTSIGGADVATGGTPTAYDVTNGAVANAFDTNNATKWGGANTSTKGWIQYQFATAQNIVEHALISEDTTPANTPACWVIQSSDDGLVWATESVVLGQLGWGVSESRTFTHSSYTQAVAIPLKQALPIKTTAINTTPTYNCLPAKPAALQASPMITGTVKQNGVVAARLVRAYRRLNSEFLGEATSDGVTGTFSINARGKTDACYVIAFDDTGSAPDYNAQIFDLVIPV